MQDEGTLVVLSTWLHIEEGEQYCWYPPEAFKPSENIAVDKRNTPDVVPGWRSLLATTVAKSSKLIRFND